MLHPDASGMKHGTRETHENHLGFVLESPAIPRAVEDHQVRRERACQVRQPNVLIAFGKNVR